MNNGELMHYGVKGMKWGVRRARKEVRRDPNVRRAKKQMNDDAHAFVSAARRTKTFAVTKRGKQKQAQREEEFKRAYNNLEQTTKNYSSAKKEAVNKAAENVKGGYTKEAKRQMVGMSTGKRVAQTLLLGSYGSKVYTNAKTQGMTKGRAAVSAIMANWGNNLTLGSINRAANRSRSRGQR